MNLLPLLLYAAAFVAYAALMKESVAEGIGRLVDGLKAAA